MTNKEKKLSVFDRLIRYQSWCDLANACEKITGEYPASKSELKKSMVWYDQRLLLKYLQ